MTITHGSLFSGVGGFDLGADKAGIKTLWQCEISTQPTSVLKRHWPNVKRYKDVNDVKGNEIDPVDIISFGSPCQDLSVAGKRKGLTGDRSGLFHQGIRIAKEMLDATEGQYPRFLIWENVRGALSSNNGDDFETVIQEMASIGAVDISYRLLNAANFGVPQRRVRVFVIADFRGECAGEILSKPTRVLWHPTKGKQKRKGTTRKTKASSGSSSLGFYHEISPTITAKWHKGNAGPAGNEVQNLVTYTENKREQTDDVSPIVDETIYFKPHLEDGARVQENTMGTLTANMGTGGNNVPMVAEVYSKAKRAENTEDYESWKEGVVSPTLNAMDNTSESFATVIAIQNTVIGRSDTAGPAGKGYKEEGDLMFTIDTTSPHAVLTENTPTLAVTETAKAFDEYNNTINDIHQTLRSGTKQSNGAIVPTLALTDREGKPGGDKGLLLTEELSPTLSYTNTQNIAEPQNKTYKVRRLTPRECERLMGWPDDHTRYDSEGNELSDSARYKMCGNGIASPVAQWVCENIVEVLSKEQDTY